MVMREPLGTADCPSGIDNEKRAVVKNGSSFPWALPKAGMESGRWPSIAAFESNALPSSQRYSFSLITPIFSSLFSFGAMMRLQYGFLFLFRL